MKALSAVMSGATLANVPLYDVTDSGPADNVVDAARIWREKWGLPKEYVPLAELTESVFLLESQSHGDAPTPVYWLDLIDLDALGRGENPDHPLATFPSYADFIEVLLRDELIR